MRARPAFVRRNPVSGSAKRPAPGRSLSRGAPLVAPASLPFHFGGRLKSFATRPIEQPHLLTLRFGRDVSDGRKVPAVGTEAGRRFAVGCSNVILPLVLVSLRFRGSRCGSRRAVSSLTVRSMYDERRRILPSGAALRIRTSFNFPRSSSDQRAALRAFGAECGRRPNAGPQRRPNAPSNRFIATPASTFALETSKSSIRCAPSGT